MGKLPVQFRDTEYRELQLKTKLLLSSLKRKDEDQKSSLDLDESSFILSPDLLSRPSSTKIVAIPSERPQFTSLQRNIIEFDLELESIVPREK